MPSIIAISKFVGTISLGLLTVRPHLPSAHFRQSLADTLPLVGRLLHPVHPIPPIPSYSSYRQARRLHSRANNSPRDPTRPFSFHPIRYCLPHGFLFLAHPNPTSILDLDGIGSRRERRAEFRHGRGFGCEVDEEGAARGCKWRGGGEKCAQLAAYGGRQDCGRRGGVCDGSGGNLG